MSQNGAFNPKPQPPTEEPVSANRSHDERDPGRAQPSPSRRNRRIDRTLLVIGILAVIGVLTSVVGIQTYDNIVVGLAGALIVSLAAIAWIILATAITIQMVSAWRRNRRQ